jgi:N-acetylglucosamine kinase-like BadF-type ATPase
MVHVSNARNLPKEFINPLPEADGLKGLKSGLTCFVGVDGGATKTIALAYNVKDDKIGFGVAGSSNPESVGTAAAVDSVRRAILDALTTVGSSSSNVACSVQSIAGITSDQDARAFEKHFSEFHSVYATNDVVAAWASGTVCTQGIAIIAGTGSHTIGVNEKGVYCRAGGWGHIMGDEGAGYIIGLSGIREALRSYDGRAEKTTLLKRLLKFYDIPSPDDMLRLVYKENLSKDKLSAFASCMAEEAVKGDAASIRIFETAGAELGIAASAVAKRLGICDAAFPVALIGSVFLSKALVVPSLQSVINECAPHAEIVFPSIPPVAGALLLALRAAGMWQAVEMERFQQRVNTVLRK